MHREMSRARDANPRVTWSVNSSFGEHKLESLVTTHQREILRRDRLNWRIRETLRRELLGE